MGHFQVRYDSRVVIYDRKAFIRLATGLRQGLNLAIKMVDSNPVEVIRQ